MYVTSNKRCELLSFVNYCSPTKIGISLYCSLENGAWTMANIIAVSQTDRGLFLKVM